jgi:hypothetical protein
VSYEVEFVAVDGTMAKVDPEDLGQKLLEFVTRFIDGIGKIQSPRLADWSVKDVTLGLAITAEANLRIVSAGATAPFQVRLTPKP